MSREALAKKTRFEVFKRDSFKCQYCGQGAPDVLLHVDHIHPVKEGGDNSITNLITACQPCNAGKGARTLSDNSAVSKQKQQMDIVNEKRIQIEMIVEWRKELQDLHKTQIGFVADQFQSRTNYSVNEKGLKTLSTLINKYPFDIVLDSVDTALNQYLEADDEDEDRFSKESVEKAFNMIPRICNVKKRTQENPDLNQLFYIRGILRNRFYSWNQDISRKVLNILEYALNQGADLDDLKWIATQSSSWTNFNNRISNLLEE